MSGNGKTHEANRESIFISSLMRTEDGRLFMWKHLQMSGVFESMFDHDPIKHSFNAGRRHAGLQLDRDLRDAAIDDYLRMIKENNSDN